MIVYLITNSLNQKKYVGMTAVSLNIRWERHQRAARNGRNTYFCNAIRKYGAFIFVPEVLCVCKNRNEAIKLEKEYINKFGLPNPIKGYNMTDGGDGTWGWKHTEEARLKMSRAKKGKPSHWKGKIRSEESRKKMSKAKAGEATSGANNSFFGKKHSEETRRKISESRVGRSMPLETRLKIANRMREVRAQKPWSTRKQK